MELRLSKIYSYAKDFSGDTNSLQKFIANCVYLPNLPKEEYEKLLAAYIIYIKTAVYISDSHKLRDALVRNAIINSTYGTGSRTLTSTVELVDDVTDITKTELGKYIQPWVLNAFRPIKAKMNGITVEPITTVNALTLKALDNKYKDNSLTLPQVKILLANTLAGDLVNVVYKKAKKNVTVLKWMCEECNLHLRNIEDFYNNYEYLHISRADYYKPNIVSYNVNTVIFREKLHKEPLEVLLQIFYTNRPTGKFKEELDKVLLNKVNEISSEHYALLKAAQADIKESNV